MIKKLKKRLFDKPSKKSIVFVSFHKCATSFFSSYILKQADGLEQVNYANQLYVKSSSTTKCHIDAKGKIYGVIRILDGKHPSFDFINEFLSNPDLDETNIIFWTRDPRDILVSMYYSFGFSHGFSSDPSIRNYQELRRERIQSMTLDEYVIDEAEEIVKKFEQMKRMMEEKNNYILLSYEEMINDFDSFFNKLSKVITLGEVEKQKIFKETRPQSTENKDQHKRKGSVGGYKEKLQPNTIHELNKKLMPILSYFNYEKARK